MDLVILPAIGPEHQDALIAFEAEAWPFSQILVAADAEDLERWATSDFASDRAGRGKGVVEVML